MLKKHDKAKQANGIIPNIILSSMVVLICLLAYSAKALETNHTLIHKTVYQTIQQTMTTQKVITVNDLLHTRKISGNFTASKINWAFSHMDIFDSIMSNIQGVLYRNITDITALDKHVQEDLLKMTANGYFPDIDYANRAQTRWIPLQHLVRLLDMSLAYGIKTSRYYLDKGLFNKIQTGLTYWYDANPLSSNWYNQWIASPQRVGEVLILMRVGSLRINPVLETNMLERMKKIAGDPETPGSLGSGANKLNNAIHWIYRGCLTKNLQVMEKGIQQAFYPLFLTKKEGLQYDYSYKQHGQQLYIGGYGSDFINGESNVALYTIGTRYSLGGEKLRLLSHYILGTYLRAIRGQYFLFNVLGRGLSRIGSLKQTGFVGELKHMIELDPKNVTAYNNAIERLEGKTSASDLSDKPAIDHTHFFSTEYSLHTGKDFSFDVRMVSDRTFRNENGNKENLLGYFLSDGATDIAVKGNEYFNIFPVWDWSMIPGTTSRHVKDTEIPRPKSWGIYGLTSFVGGLSDSSYGISAYDMLSDDTRAKKSWFFFDKEIVCLGAGISSNSTDTVYTTLNQCLQDGNVQVEQSGKILSLQGAIQEKRFANTPNWVLHGRVGYFFPIPEKVCLNTKIQTGTWQRINSAQDSDTVTKKVFSLWIDHGKAPINGNYAYIVLPNIQTGEAMQNYEKQNRIEILYNDSSIQAVCNKALHVWQIVFYNAGQVFQKDGFEISVNAPCLLMLQQTANHKLKLTLSDPTQSLSTIQVKIKQNATHFSTIKEIELTTDPYKGKSVSMVLDKNE